MVRTSRRLAFLVSVLLTVALISPATARASNLWGCYPFGGGDIAFRYVCTRVRGAPSTGIHVLDRSNGAVVTWYNGTSVALEKWAWDLGTSCGVNGDNYVWAVGWYAGGTDRWGVLGDWWLDTGSSSEWGNWGDTWGALSNGYHYAGNGSGTCNNFNPTSTGWW